MISHFTRKARCAAGSSGGWRWQRSPADDMDRYLDLLRGDANELDLLAKDLLINVTSFFRDPKVFDRLSETIVPELIRDRPSDQPIRIWIAGLQHRRGDVFPRHDFPGANHGGRKRRQAAGVRLRRRCRCGGARAGGPVSGGDRGRRDRPHASPGSFRKTIVATRSCRSCALW